MNDENWVDDLLNRYPLTLGKVRGLEVGIGWRSLIIELCDTIEPILAKLPSEERPYAEQVKEKFGGLRFYMSSPHLEIDVAITKAERRSARICEACGADGERGWGYWSETLCIRCRANRIGEPL